MDEAGQRWSQADEANLRSSITDLASLVTGHWGLEGLMEQIATFSVRAIPGADGVGVTLLRHEASTSRVEALAASAPSSPRSTPSSTRR